jgi:aryl-alcohol dehydrogenase-like predicted oxidoreductase
MYNSLMTFRRLGSTSILVSPIGLGMAALGRPGYINLGHAADLAHGYSIGEMQAHAWSVLDAAWASGVRYFDAARSYGRGEEFLGGWLRNRAISPQQVAVGSKWGYTYTADWQVQAERHEVKDHSLPVLQRQWLETQTNLSGLLSLYQVHSATLDSGVLDNSAVLNELVRLKQAGVAIGLSLSGSQQAITLERAASLIVDGVRVFDAVQATWNLLEPSAGAALAAARADGIGVIVKEALANGRLTQRNSDPAFAGKLDLLVQHAQRLKTTIDALCLAAVLAQPWVDVALSGAASEEQVRSNLGALEVRLDAEAMELISTLAEPPQHYWAQRAGLAWN